MKLLFCFALSIFCFNTIFSQKVNCSWSSIIINTSFDVSFIEPYNSFVFGIKCRNTDNQPILDTMVFSVHFKDKSYQLCNEVYEIYECIELNPNQNIEYEKYIYEPEAYLTDSVFLDQRDILRFIDSLYITVRLFDSDTIFKIDKEAQILIFCEIGNEPYKIIYDTYNKKLILRQSLSHHH